MALNEYLKELEEQKVQEESKIQVVINPNPVLDIIYDRYEQWLGVGVCAGFGHSDEYDATPLIKDLKYSVKDVRAFSFRMNAHEKLDHFDISGYFLSSLIDNCEGNNFEVITSFLSMNIWYFGCKNFKNSTVIGNLGGGFGYCMRDGVLEIRGNTGTSPGWKMTGGVIKINGNTGPLVGENSEGGEIYVNGRIESISDDCKAKVFHKGVQIWPK